MKTCFQGKRKHVLHVITNEFVNQPFMLLYHFSKLL